MNSDFIKQTAFDLGFDLVGIAPALAIGDEAYLRKWLDQGCQGQMAYLQNNVEKRCDVQKLFEWSKSVICVAMNYYAGQRQFDSKGQGKVARYAWREDYHIIMKQRLAALQKALQRRVGGKVRFRACVDTAPILEKAYASRAGLGWIGKNTLLVNKDFGSWLVLGELVTDLCLDSDEPVADGCGDCRQCLDACPTNALVAPRELDARKCISYKTIESGEPWSSEELKQMDNWVFGCDICQNVCPYNCGVPRCDKDWPIEPACQTIDISQASALTETQFNEIFSKSPIARMGYHHFLQRCKGM